MRTVESIIKQKPEAMGAEMDLQHIDNPVEIASRAIMSTPAVIIDGKLVHKGGLPRDVEIEAWIK